MHDIVLQGFSKYLDILVNNTAYIELFKLFLESDLDIYWQI
jgi:hypothetical protein